jgi:hypothetical protein
MRCNGEYMSSSVRAKINISKLKEFVLTKCSKDSPLYAVFSGEVEEMDAAEFEIKLKLWLKLAKGKLL